jgi:hypothetical protein
MLIAEQFLKSQHMQSIRFLQMVELGILKLVTF